jgi:spermidine synthase
MQPYPRRILFLLFFLSGFSGLVYQVVWTRMAFASFGIITPVLSVVLSVFMLGLAVGAWVGGRWISNLTGRTGWSAAVFYAGTELMIGVGAFVVPRLFAAGEQWLLAAGESGSTRYLLLSALVLGFSILPWCLFMGTTFPLMMAYIREQNPGTTGSFSFLYLANVLGAMTGTLLTALVFIELFGFRHTLWIAAASNCTVAAISGWLGLRRKHPGRELERETPPASEPARAASAGMDSGERARRKWILFATGFCAMAMEVVWTRAFTPVLTTQVYSFASILFAYLGATSLGSMLYRSHRREGKVFSLGRTMTWLAIAVFLPVLASDPRLVTANGGESVELKSAISVVASICPFCAALGYLTPGLIDEYAAGDPARGGSAYALNVLGCILGPLFAGYILLPSLGVRYALMLLGTPFIAGWVWCGAADPWRRRWKSALAVAGIALCALLVSRDFEEWMSMDAGHTEVRRDYAASVVSCGEYRQKKLLVNGVGMTVLTPITKWMVHLPLALHPAKPESALIICFGMGTSYRSALSWDLDTTAVELVPGVKDAFSFYFADASSQLANPRGRIVVDDGRRFLQRGTKQYDLVVVDPPPPVVAAGSSLLYSTKFYELVKRRLKPDGIVAVWFPGGDPQAGQAVLRSLTDSFPYTRCFVSIEGYGAHLLGSRHPLENPGAAELARRLPPGAQKDLLEWNSSVSPQEYFEDMLSREYNATNALNRDQTIRVTDDHPYNEYYLLRERRQN